MENPFKNIFNGIRKAFSRKQTKVNATVVTQDVSKSNKKKGKAKPRSNSGWNPHKHALRSFHFGTFSPPISFTALRPRKTSKSIRKKYRDASAQFLKELRIIDSKNGMACMKVRVTQVRTLQKLTTAKNVSFVDIDTRKGR